MNTTTKATRSQMVDFIHQNITMGGRAISKKSLQGYTDDQLESICNKFADDFKKFCENPPIKLQKFYAEGTKGQKSLLFETKGPDMQSCIDDLTAQGITIQKIVPAKGHHICKYCKGIADGSDADALCEECQRIFGHAFFREL